MEYHPFLRFGIYLYCTWRKYKNMAYNLVGPPTGSTTEVQYNNNGIMGASSSLSYNGTFLNVTGGINLAGQSVLSTVSERTNLGSAASGTVTFDTNGTSIFYNSGPTGNVTANFTNVPTNSNRTTSVTVILSQSATPRLINVLQVNSTASTINWANSIIPTPNANKYDVFGFSLIRSGSTWISLGQMSTYG